MVTERVACGVFPNREIDSLVIDPEFAAVLEQDADAVEKLRERIKRNGYDLADPVIVWKGHDVIVDGHTRVRILGDLGVEQVPVNEREYATRDDVLRDIIDMQASRRNISRASLARAIRLQDERKPQGQRTDLASNDAKSPGRSRQETARKLGTSPATIDRHRYVQAHGDEETKRRMDDGEITVGAAWTQTRRRVAQEKPSPPPRRRRGEMPPEPMGMYHANRAVDELSCIGNDDKQRKQAFSHVMAWIQKRTEENNGKA